MANESKHSGYDDEKMAMINCDIIHEYAIKLDNMIDEDTRLEEWVKMKLSKVELMVASVKHALVGIETYDDGGEIAKKQLLHIGKYAEKLIEMLKGGSELMSWMESNLSICADYMDSIYHHLDYKLLGNRASDLGGMGMDTRKQDIPGFEGTLSGLDELSIRRNGGGVGFSIYENVYIPSLEKMGSPSTSSGMVTNIFTENGKEMLAIELRNGKGIKIEASKVEKKYANGGGVDDIKYAKLKSFIENKKYKEAVDYYLYHANITSDFVGSDVWAKLKKENNFKEFEKSYNNDDRVGMHHDSYAKGGGVGDGDAMTHEEFVYFVKSKVNKVAHGYSYKGKKYTNITDLGKDLGYRFNGDKWIKLKFAIGGGVELEDEEAEWYDKQTLKYKNQTEQDRKATHRHYYNMYNDEFTKWWYSGGMEESMKKYAKKLRNEDDFNTAWSLAFEDFIVRKEGGKFAKGGGVEKMERGSRLNTNWVGRKEKEMWGQYDLSEMYNNNLDLIADVHDYFEKLKMDISEGYSNDIKKNLIEVLKTGNLKGQSLQENIKF